MKSKLILLYVFTVCGFGIFPASSADLLDAVDSEIYWSLAEIEYEVESLVPLLTAKTDPAMDEASIDKHIENLASPEFVVRTRSMAALSRMGFKAREALEEALKSDSPEVVASAKQLLSKLGRTADDSRMHRLMAIRALGEIGEESAIPHLEKIADSKDPFVADYVARALAEIRDGKFTPEKPDPKALTKDLVISYPELSGVFHAKLPARKGKVSIRDAMDKAVALVAKLKIGGAPGIARLDIDGALTDLTGDLISLYRQVGNVRIESVTVTAPNDEEFGGEAYIYSIRGRFDRMRVREFLMSETVGKFMLEIGGLKWLTDGVNTFVHLLGDDHAVVVSGFGAEDSAMSLVPKLKGEEKAAAAGAVVDLLKELPEDATLAFAWLVSEKMAADNPALKEVKSMALWSKPLEAGGSRLTTKVEGADKAKVIEVFTQMNMLASIGKAMLPSMAKEDEDLAIAADILKTLEMDRDGAIVEVSANLPDFGDAPLGAVLAGLGTLKILGENPEMVDGLIEEGLKREDEVELMKEFKFEFGAD